MLRILVGTKGQLIKMAPIMMELDNKGYDYQLIHAMQHSNTLDRLLKLFNLKRPDLKMWGYKEDIVNSKQILKWLVYNSLAYTIGSQKKKIAKKDKDIILVHGDAPPVLLGLFIGLLNGYDIGHVEAGLRSKNLLSPFPEEIIRILADRFSDILFPLSDFAFSNLKKGYKNKIFPIKRNTVYDAVRYAVKQKKNTIIDDYVLMSIHRFETIQSKERLKFIVYLIKEITKRDTVIIPLHPSTKHALLKYGLYEKINSMKNVIITPLMDYFTFISHIKNSKYLVTDGGGPQEESYYLGTPCLILRDATERPIWPNIAFTGFNWEKIKEFLKNYEHYRTNEINDDYSPSKEIVKILQKLEYI